MEARSGFRVLAVENDPVFREFLKTWLDAMDMQARVVENGLQALKELRSRQFNVLVTDLVMPHIDGTTLCRILRRCEEWQDMFIVVVTATAPEDHDLSARIPADAFIAKRPLEDMKGDLERVFRAYQQGETIPRHVLGAEQLAERQITKELLQRDQNWSRAYEKLQEGVLALTEDNFLVALNPAAEHLLGISAHEALGLRLEELFPELEIPREGVHRWWYKGRRLELDAARPGNSGDDKPNRAAVWTLIVRDVTKEQEATDALQRTVNDRELMMRELHHRLKNNIYMVAGYIDLQSDQDLDAHARQALQAVRSNLESMAMAHERLYRESSLSDISFGDYLQDVVHAAASMRDAAIVTRVTAEGSDCAMDMSRALRLGLVINELVINAVEHAFPERRGEIVVALKTEDGGHSRLTVQDDGVGIPSNSEGFGMQIVHALVEQIGGEVQFLNNRDLSDGTTPERGTTVMIRFSCEEAGEREG